MSISHFYLETAFSDSTVDHGRYGHTACVSSDQNQNIFVFGGMKYDRTYTNEVMMFRTVDNQWNSPEIFESKGDVPSPRAYSSCVVYKNFMYIFGGKGIDVTNDLYEFDLEYHYWKEVPYASKYPVPKVYGHCAFVEGDVMYVFGGKDEKRLVSWDMWSFDFITSRWNHIIPSDPLSHPPKRFFASSTIYHKKALVFGGTNDENFGLSDLWSFDFHENEWMEISSKNRTKSERFGHSMFFVGDVLHILGGYHDGKDVDTVLTLDFESGKWNSLSKADLKLQRFSHATFFSATYIKKTLYLFGGIQKVKYDGKPLYAIEWDSMMEIKASVISYNVAVHILTYLTIKDRLNLSLVSKKLTLSTATQDNSFWRPFYSSTFHISEKEVSDLIKSSSNSLYLDFFKQMTLLTHQIVGTYKYKDHHHKFYNSYGFEALRIHGYPFEPQKESSRRIYLLGDVKVGKSSMISVLGGQMWPHSNLPGFHDEMTAQFEIGDESFPVNIYDMDHSLKDSIMVDLGVKEAAKNRSVFILCFSIASRETFENVKTRYYTEIKNFAPDLPMILCGTMCDLRNREDEEIPKFVKFVSSDEAIALAKELGCVTYLETSVLFPKKVETLLNVAGVTLSLESQRFPKKDCILQ